MSRPRYPIRAVTKLTGIPVDTLRAWERRYAAVVPERDERGRIYSEADVERLRLLRRAVEAGHAIGRVAPLSADDLRALLMEPATPRLPSPAAVPSSGGDLAALQGAVERFDGPALRRELSRRAAILPARAFCRDVALPFLNWIGEAWAAGELDIAREHLVTAELRSLLGALARLRDAGEGTDTLVFATPSGEQHELGVLAAAVVAADSGFGAVFLGASLPAGEIVSAAVRVGAPAVVLGWTGSDSAAGVPDARLAIGEVARSLDADVELWVGGRGAREAVRATGGRATPLESFAAYERVLSRLANR